MSLLAAFLKTEANIRVETPGLSMPMASVPFVTEYETAAADKARTSGQLTGVCR